MRGLTCSHAVWGAATPTACRPGWAVAIMLWLEVNLQLCCAGTIKADCQRWLRCPEAWSGACVNLRACCAGMSEAHDAQQAVALEEQAHAHAQAQVQAAAQAQNLAAKAQAHAHAQVG